MKPGPPKRDQGGTMNVHIGFLLSSTSDCIGPRVGRVPADVMKLVDEALRLHLAL